MRSDSIKEGLARAPHRSLLKADGFTDEELDRPLLRSFPLKTRSSLAIFTCRPSLMR